MIIFGDLASPTLETTKNLSDFLVDSQHLLEDDFTLVNLEGLITNDKTLIESEKSKLFNHSQIINALSQIRCKVVALANNHVFDLPDDFKELTRITCSKRGINCIGLEPSKGLRKKYVQIVSEGVEYFVFNACWDYMISVLPDSVNSEYEVNNITFKLVDEVKEIRKLKKSAHIVLYFHWGFDLEHLPLPMDRELSKALIDAGADLVIGSHPHRIQGGEKYKNGYIIYSLGNFFIPHEIFGRGKLKYPAYCNESLIIKWTRDRYLYCSWLNYHHNKGRHELTMTTFEKFEESKKIVSYTPFKNMDEQSYLSYYRKNRNIGKRSYPVFKSYRNKLANKLKYKYIVFLNRYLSKYIYRF